MTSLHEAEVARRFDALSRRFKSTLASDDYRLRGLLQSIGPVKGLAILDLGCGKGRFARALRSRGARVLGIDVSAAMLAEAVGVDRVRASARRLPVRTGCMDGVIAIETFEHLEACSRAAVLREARRVLKPGAFLAIVDKNAGSLSARRPWLPSAVVKRVDERRGLWMYPANGPVRENWFWPSRFKKELSRFFEDVQVIRLISPLEQQSWLFRWFPRIRLMTLWLARRPGGPHV